MSTDSFTTTQQAEPEGYQPTKEERKVLSECAYEANKRGLPLAMVAAAVTRALILKGKLSPSPKLGSIPKMCFAGYFGWAAGYVLYSGQCAEKLMKLENSPRGKALRQQRTQRGLPPIASQPQGPTSELSDPDHQSFEPMFQAADPQSHPAHQTMDYSPPDPPTMGHIEDFNLPAQSYQEGVEEEPKKKRILYEDLRNKNRETYEVQMTQRAESLMKPAPTRPAPEREAVRKKNIYGDDWDE